LLRTAYLLTGDLGRAEDLVQGALVRAHRHWSKLQREGGAEAYVRKIMVNLNTDWWRRLGSREHAVSAVPDARAEADAYAAFDLQDELWTALRGLPARMRAVLVLRYFEDLSEAETASILGCSTGTVKSQCSRGLGRLRLALGSAK
jgi:RNA polymerase sigma-70 factor (sigma-E family)